MADEYNEDLGSVYLPASRTRQADADRCPQCGSQINDYFDNADNWTILQDFVCEYEENGSYCGDCVRIAECNDEVWCRRCATWLDMYARVRQPCGENEHVVELRFSVQKEDEGVAGGSPTTGS